MNDPELNASASAGANMDTSKIGADSLPHLPPSNLEVKIRTMASDTEAVGKGGGLLGIAEKISISLPPADSAPEANAPLLPAKAVKNKALLYAGLGLSGAVALFALGYFLPIFFSKKEAPPPGAPAAATAAPSAATTTPPAAVNIHKALFNVPADLVLSAAPLNGTPAKEKWFASLGSASSTLAELVAQTAAGAPLGFLEFLAANNVRFGSQDLISSNFQADFTFFAYKDTAGIWPGYVLKLKPGTTPLLVKKDISKLEQENDFISFALAGTSGEKGAAFADAQLLGQPVRELIFGSKPAAFVYGWFHSDYLIMGASENAVKAAVARL